MDIAKAAFTAVDPGTAQAPRKTLHWRKDERMAGMVPVWEPPSKTQKETVARNLDLAAQTEKTRQEMPSGASFEAALAYAAAPSRNPDGTEEEFGFADLVDMVNPLQHIPIVGHFYREITGDEIKPISKIVGGGVFGGAAGVAGALVNTVVEYETGSDIAGNIVTLAMDGQMPRTRSGSGPGPAEIRKNLDRAAAGETRAPLPGALLGFADLRQSAAAPYEYERVPAAEGRTAGTILKKRTSLTPPLPAREPVSSLTLSDSPPVLNAEEIRRPAG